MNAFHLLIALILAEGTICLLFPGFVKRVVELSPPEALRIAGAVEIAVAALIVALSR